MNKCDISNLVGRPELPCEVSGYFIPCNIKNTNPYQHTEGIVRLLIWMAQLVLAFYSRRFIGRVHYTCCKVCSSIQFIGYSTEYYLPDLLCIDLILSKNFVGFLQDVMLSKKRQVHEGVRFLVLSQDNKHLVVFLWLYQE